MLRQRLETFRGARCFPDLNGKVVVLVDDGLASGFTMLAAAESVKSRDPRKIIVAVPTASEGAVELLVSSVDEMICLNLRRGPIFAVADAYKKWYDLSDDEVLEYLRDLP
jgi:predicted phosphoribosyltransferase